MEAMYPFDLVSHPTICVEWMDGGEMGIFIMSEDQMDTYIAPTNR